MGMPAPPSERPPIPALPPGEVWTADRVRAELCVDDPDEPLSRYRFEFLDGELLVTSSPAYVHQRAVGELFVLLREYVSRTGIGEALMSPSDVELAPNNTAQPDVYVIPLEEGRRLLALRRHEPARQLLLAAEVLSPSSVRHDRLTKRRHYVRNRVEYWVVDRDARLIERNAPGEAGVELHDEELVWHPAGAPEPLVIDVAAYFTRVLGPDPDAEPGVGRG
jgi:Uma2 family endonuclease